MLTQPQAPRPEAPGLSAFHPEGPASGLDEDDSLDELTRPFPQKSDAPAQAPVETGFRRYYGLQTNPFADAIAPDFFYRTEGHAEAFRSMMLAADFAASLAMLTAPSGTGKTLITQLLVQHLGEPDYQTILVLVTPGLSKTGLLREMLSELNVALPVGLVRVQDLVKLLSNQIIDLYEEGRRLVVIIDEAHLLSADCLHIVRTLSNIEIPERKLVTCLLIGESRLATRLDRTGYESLRNRIYLRATLEPLSPAETEQYIKYRLIVAGHYSDLFTPQALMALHVHSKGIPRTINKLALLSLAHGAAHQLAAIDAGIVEAQARRS